MATGDLGSAGGMAARVLRTGLAVVHEGELVLPAAGSEAEAEFVADDARSVIHYYFPIEIEVRSVGEATDRHDLISSTLDALTQAVESLA
jgi:hypothetical protein